MGWWRIDNITQGQIDLSDLFRTGPGLLNRSGGQDTYENHYNGDGPADIVGDAVDELAALLHVESPKLRTRCRKEEVLDFFVHNQLCPTLERLPMTVVEELRESTLLLLHLEYEEEWGRPAYEEEVTASFMFVLNALFESNEEEGVEQINRGRP